MGVSQKWVVACDGSHHDTEEAALAHEASTRRVQMLAAMYERSPHSCNIWMQADWAAIRTVVGGTDEEAKAAFDAYMEARSED